MRFTKPKGVQVRNLTIPAGDRWIRLLVVSPEGVGPGSRVPGVLWLHGGGYATGMPEMVYESRAIDLVSECGAVVVSPAYTLSPIGPYPKALMQCHETLLWMRDHAAELGIRDDQLMVGGESAGGGLCAALCMYELDHQGVRIAFQMPLYPMLDCEDTPSSRDNHAKVWNTRRNHQAWVLYLRKLAKDEPVPAYASPARRERYADLPPCYTFVGDLEPFYCETLAYVDALRAAGVPANVDVYEDFYHARDMFEPDDPAVRAAAARFVERFREACALYTAPQA